MAIDLVRHRDRRSIEYHIYHTKKLVLKMLSVLLMMLSAVFASMVVIDEIPGDNGVTTTYNNTLNTTEFKICVNNDTSGQLLIADIAVNDSILVYNNTVNATGERMINCLAQQGIDHSSWVTTNIDLIGDYEQLTIIQEEITHWVSYSWRGRNTTGDMSDQSGLAEDDSYLQRRQTPDGLDVDAFNQKNRRVVDVGLLVTQIGQGAYIS